MNALDLILSKGCTRLSNARVAASMVRAREWWATVHVDEHGGASLIMKRDIQIDFQLLGTELPPSEITRRIGVTPDLALLRGERNPKLDIPRQSIWSLRSTSFSDRVVDHWHDLEATLCNSKEAIREIGGTGIVKFTIIVTAENRLPSLIIPSEMSAFAGFVGAVIDIDHLQ